MSGRNSGAGLSFLIAPSLALLFSVASAGGGDQQFVAQRSFTDSDLRKYESPRSQGGAPSAGAIQGKPPDAAVSSEQKPQADRQYWCDTATKYRQDLERSKQDLTRAEEDQRLANDAILYGKEINETTLGALNKARDAVEEARRRIQSAEQNLKAFEEDARVKNVPPRWLECYFE